MTLTFGVFPPEIVGRILDLDGMSCCTIKLWICGNRALQYQIAHGVSRLRFVDHKKISLSRLPLFVENLQALRHLTIDRGSYGMLASDNVWKSIRKLRPTLKTLELIFANSYRALHLPQLDWDKFGALFEENFTIDDDGDTWSIQEAFPVLETLDIDGPNPFALRDLASLPPTLTSLGWRVPSVDTTKTQEHIEALPRGLLRLCVYCHNAPEAVASWRYLPRSLTCLETAYETNTINVPIEELQNLPPTLTEIKNVIYLWPAVKHLSLLPHTLTYLELDDFESHDDSSPSKETQLHLAEFRSLKSFGTSFYDYVPLLPDNVRSMPPSLNKLRVSVNLDEMKPKYWPLSLETLKLKIPNWNYKFEMLPSCLTSLTLSYPREPDHAVDTRLFAELPRGLRALSCTCQAPSPDVSFPPNLTKLDLYSVRGTLDWNLFYIKNPQQETLDYDSAVLPRVAKCFPYQNLPSSLLKLELPTSIPASRIKHLPKALKELHISHIVIDAEFDPTDAHELQATAEVNAVGRAHGICDFPVYTKTTSAFALLPRTLKSLVLASKSHLPSNTDWKALPPRLEVLDLHDQNCAPDAIFQLNLTHMTNLHFYIPLITDKHIMAIPRSVKRLQLDSKDSDEDSLTTKALLYLNPNGLNSWLSLRLKKQFEWLTTRRKEAMLGSDPKELEHLLSLDGSVWKDCPLIESDESSSLSSDGGSFFRS